MMKTNEISLKVTVDENNLPHKIEWNAQGGGSGECRSIMLALWDEKESGTLRIDLWTKEMMIDEMKKFYVQNVLTLTDTFSRATGDDASAKKAREFFVSLGKEMGVLDQG